MSAEINLYKQKFYRNDIQGIRALSALTIMVYHIWLNKVSGGVDVFFVISGFLIGTQILGSLGPGGSFNVINFLSKILTRITPSAALVLVTTIALVPLLSPPSLWKFSVNELVAAAFHIENIELMRQSTNYLNREDPPSEFQQFWALSIQVQFFIILAATAFVSRSAKGDGNSIVRFKRLVSILFVCSLAWSIYYTHVEPAKAYFNTFTRLWEFLAGCLVATAYPHLRARNFKNGVASSFYYAALVLLFMAGLLIPATTHYPGFVSLLPVSLACTFIVAGSICSNTNVLARLLSSPAMTRVGNASFGVYLWHWPLLIFAQHHFDSTKLGLVEGVSIMAIAVALALISERYYERAARNKLQSFGKPTALMICGFVVVMIGSSGLMVRQYMIKSAEEFHMTQNGPGAQDMPSFKDFLYVDYDRPPAIKNCLGRVCEFGDLKSKFTMALVGDSHAAQWQPVIDHLGKTHKFKVVTILSHPKQGDVLKEVHPDSVLTIGTRVLPPEGHGPNEGVTKEFIKLLAMLRTMDIPVAAIRDNPRFSFRQNACLWRNQADPGACALNRKDVFSATNPSLSHIPPQQKFEAIDLSDLFCTATSCPANSRGRLIYYDRHHFSHSFLKSIQEQAGEEILRQAPGIFPPQTSLRTMELAHH